MAAGQFHADLRPGWTIAQVEIDQGDVAILGAGERGFAVGGNGADVEPGILDNLLDFERDENLVFYNQNLLAHALSRCDLELVKAVSGLGFRKVAKNPARLSQGTGQS